MKPLIILLLLPLQICAQDITGLWTGFIHTTDKNLPYELAISEYNGTLTGYSHTTFTLNGVEEIGVKALTIKKKNSNVLVEDEALVFNDFSIAPVKGIRQSDFLVLIVEDTAMMLNGTFKTNKIRDYRSITGTIELRKVDTSKKTKIIPKLNELNLLNTLSFLQPKLNQNEAVVISLASVEKVKGDIPTKKETVVSAPITIKAPLVIQPQPKEIAGLTTSAKETKPEITVEPKEKQTAITTPSPSIKKSEVALQPVTQEKETIANSVEKNRKSQVVLQPPVKKEQVVIVAPSPKEKVPGIILQQKEKQVVSTAPVIAIKKPQQPAPPTQEKEKQVALISKPSPIKKVPPDTIVKTKPASIVSIPSVIKPTPVQVAVVSAAELTKRKTEMIQNVFFKSDSLLLSLYDNGEVDGDTVSVVLNGKVIIARQGLSTNAITKTVYTTPDLGDSLQLVMYAENLGSIPPNTGLLILQDGNDRYEIRFAGDFQKNSAIILRRRKNQ